MHAERPSPNRRRVAATAWLTVAVLSVALVGCTDDPEISVAGSEPDPASCAPERDTKAVTAEQVEQADVDGTTVRLVTHDSFVVSDGLFDQFTAETGITVEQLASGDAGTVVSQSILTAGNPVGDVLFGIDTTLLCRGTSEGLFVPYRPAALDTVDEQYQLASDDLATPIDVGDVCLNYSKTAFPDPEDAPQSLQDLTDPRFADAFVTENPESSSPGLAFLLATVAEFGEDGWEQYWEDLRDNGVQVDPGWEEAYNQSFAAGSGDRSIVTSYATSPVADVLFSDPPRTEPNIGVIADACFRQVEFAGILRGTEQPEAAALLIDFMLSPEFQADIPLNMFVEPVNPEADVPAEFEANRTTIEDPLVLDPATIEAGRDRWTERWTEIVLR